MGVEESATLSKEAIILDLSGQNLETLVLDEQAEGEASQMTRQLNQIRSIPGGLCAITDLNLAKNRFGRRMEELANQLKGYPNLSRLNLSNNSIETFPESFFTSTKFTELSVSENKLKELNLQDSTIESLDSSQNHLIEMPLLSNYTKSLNVSANSIQSLIGDFDNLINLNISMNGLSTIGDDAKFMNLKTLDISRNNLSNLPDISKITPNLETLDCSHNKLVELANLPKSLKDLNARYNNLESLPDLNSICPILTTLNLSFNKISSIPLLPATLVNFLGFENEIVKFEPVEAPDLQRVLIGHNHLIEIPQITSNSLKEYNISFNKLISIDQNCIPDSIEALDVSNNYITEIPEELFKFNMLKILYIHNNQIQRIPKSIESSNIKKINISMNLLRELPDNLPHSLQLLNVSFCKLTSLPQSLETLEHLNEIVISHNEIDNIPLIPNLKVFRATHNKFASLPNFSYSIETIDIAFNKLTAIENNPFPHLEEADFSHNNITSIPNPFQYPNIKYLFLSDNPIDGEYCFSMYDVLHTLTLEKTNIVLKSPIPNCHKIRTENRDICKNSCFSYVRLDPVIGYAEMRGRRKTMEDAIIAIRTEVLSIYGILDGHGGDFTSAFTAFQISNNLTRIMELPFTRETVFHMIKSIFACVKSVNVKDGSTMNVAFRKGNDLIIANIGDSRSIIIRNDGSIKFQTKDHTNSTRSEFNRIRKQGGNIINNRVGGRIGLARSLGDLTVKGVSPSPDITKLTIDENDKWLVVGCDGLFDYISPDMIQEVAQTAVDPYVFAYDLRDRAYSQNEKDNISVLVVRLDK